MPSDRKADFDLAPRLAYLDVIPGVRVPDIYLFGSNQLHPTSDVRGGRSRMPNEKYQISRVFQDTSQITR
jgi:hypothetical protein